MSKIDVFDITVSQLEHFAKVAYEDISAQDFIGKYLVVTTWSWFAHQPKSMMVAYSPRDTEHAAMYYATGLDHNDLCANRMGISKTGNHYEIWHVVEDPISTPDLDGYEGEGWYTVSYSDGGQDYTNDGPVWIEDALSFADIMAGAMETATETHLPYAEYHGTGEGGSSPVYQRYELLSYLGEYVDDYDVDAIEHDVTKYDPIRGCLVWTVFGVELSDVCARHECSAESVDDIEPEPIDWFGVMGDTLEEDDGLRECREAYEYVRALDEMF